MLHAPKSFFTEYPGKEYKALPIKNTIAINRNAFIIFQRCNLQTTNFNVFNGFLNHMNDVSGLLKSYFKKLFSPPRAFQFFKFSDFSLGNKTY